MKKLFAMFMAFLTSLSTSTEFTLSEDKPYSGNYYTVAQYEMPDYRVYYDSSATLTNDDVCKTGNFSANGKQISDSKGYWFINGISPDLKSDEIKNTKEVHYKNNKPNKDNTNIEYYSYNGLFIDGNYIIMPYSGVLLSESKTNDCKSMTLLCNNQYGKDFQYKIIINNMDCWYCDIGKTGESEYHTGNEQSGKKFKAGNVIGRATSDTTVRIIPVLKGKSVGTVTLVQFYKGTYTEYKK